MGAGHRGRFGLLAALIAVGAGVAGIPAMAQEDSSTGPVRIGMVRTLFRDVPAPMILALMKPFGAMMESQTGLAGQLVASGNALELGRQLAADKVQLGVFHGIEFAWARQQHPELRPLMIAVNQDCHLRALLVVRKHSRAACAGDLAGRALAIPRGSREHCHLFLEGQCKACGKDPAHLFRRITASPNAEEALDDLVDNEVQGVVVDAVAFDCFQRRKPGRCASLRVAAESEVFPAAVVAYRPGSLNGEDLGRFRDGMIRANKSAIGRQLLTLWKLTGFEPVPADYQETLDRILKAYPAPRAVSK